MNQPETRTPGRQAKVRSLVGFLLRSVIAGLALAFILLYLKPSIGDRFSTRLPAVATVPAAPESYADAVDRTAPSVVSIYTKTVKLQQVSPRMQKILGTPYVARSRADMGSGKTATY